MSWDGTTADWWVQEVDGDPAYRDSVDPLLQRVVGDDPGGLVLDLGCGNGRSAGLFSTAVGIDSSMELATAAGRVMQVCVADVLRLPFAEGSASGAFAVLVLEHVADHDAFFGEMARVVEQGGWLALVVNHPLWTAPGSGPFVDPTDGEVLWRWGGYLSPGYSDEPAGSGTVRFHHRSVAVLLESASVAGWSLEVIEEEAVTPYDDPILEAQQQIPRLLGVRWRRRPLQGPGPRE